MLWARSLPSLKSALPYLAVCLALTPWLFAAPASPSFLEVHLGSGETFFREKRTKQQFLNLTSENKKMQQASTSYPHLSYDFWCNFWKRILKNIVGVFEAAIKPGHPSARSTWSSAVPSQHVAGAPSTSLPSHGAQPSLGFVLVTQGLRASQSHTALQCDRSGWSVLVHNPHPSGPRCPQRLSGWEGENTEFWAEITPEIYLLQSCAGLC